MTKRLRVWVEEERVAPWEGIDGYVSNVLAAVIPVPPTSVKHFENGWTGDRGWTVAFDIPDDKLDDPPLVQWLAEGRARTDGQRAKAGGAWSIWSSLPGDDVWGWEIDYTPKGDPTVHVDVAINSSWNDCVRVTSWREPFGAEDHFMLNRDNARALADLLTEAADRVDRMWPR